ncbi:MAG: Tyrosine recombinase XerC [Phycisphaerae bacterium]|nr:Tyrosine recombinase XerC [Phycisphaerae bacterium]
MIATKNITAPRNPGRPAKHYETSWGEIISGLTVRANGRFYPVGRSDVSFGSDEEVAVHKYRKWIQEQADPDSFVRLSEFNTVFGLNCLLDFEKRAARFGIQQPETIVKRCPNLSRVYRDHFRHLILTDPKQAAVDLDVKHLAWYPAKPEKLQWNLPELCEYYLENKRNHSGEKLDKRHLKHSARWWNDFLDCTGASEIRDISHAMIKKYYDQLMGQFDARQLSADSVRLRFAKVKTIIKYGMDHSGKEQEKQALRLALDLCSILQAPVSITNPKPIDIADFHALLAVARPRERAVLLLGLNAAMHAGEVSKIKKSEIDIEKRMLNNRRSKTAQPRVAWLWERTVRAISAYLKEQPTNKTEYLFVSRTGRPLTGESIRQLMVTLRNRAGLSKKVNFEGLRDAAYGIAERVDAHHAKFIAGHKTGMSDRYVLREADNPCVQDCCNAIEEYFFGGMQTL